MTRDSNSRRNGEDAERSGAAEGAARQSGASVARASPRIPVLHPIPINIRKPDPAIWGDTAFGEGEQP